MQTTITTRPHQDTSPRTGTAATATQPSWAPPSLVPSISPLLCLRLELAGAELWRAIDSTGRVIGHLRRVTTPDGLRFRAQRFKASAARFVDLGDFWSADEAAWCLHFSA